MSPRPFPDELRRDVAMLKWLRREVNRDLRYWRSDPAALPAARYHDLAEDCKAKLALINWAEHWQGVRTAEYARDHYHADRPDVAATMAATMESNAQMVMYAMRRVATGYRAREGWRPEWDVQK